MPLSSVGGLRKGGVCGVLLSAHGKIFHRREIFLCFTPWFDNSRLPSLLLKFVHDLVRKGSSWDVYYSFLLDWGIR